MNMEQLPGEFLATLQLIGERESLEQELDSSFVALCHGEINLVTRRGRFYSMFFEAFGERFMLEGNGTLFVGSAVEEGDEEDATVLQVNGSLLSALESYLKLRLALLRKFEL